MCLLLFINLWPYCSTPLFASNSLALWCYQQSTVPLQARMVQSFLVQWYSTGFVACLIHFLARKHAFSVVLEVQSWVNEAYCDPIALFWPDQYLYLKVHSLALTHQWRHTVIHWPCYQYTIHYHLSKFSQDTLYPTWTSMRMKKLLPF